MALKFVLNNKFEAIAAILDEYQAWFAAFLQSGTGQMPVPPTPELLKNWFSKINFEDFDIDHRYMDRKNALIKSHDSLVNYAPKLIGPQADKAAPEFVMAFRIFLKEMHTFSQSVAIEQWGFDMLTGLKNKAAMREEFAVELSRLAREGSPFCIALARIDNFDEIESANDTAYGDEIILKVSDMFKRSLRTYDEAFRVRRDHFVMFIKQSDITGGQKALLRLRDILIQEKETYQIEAQRRPISLSCCVKEPLPDDEFDELMANLYFDLDNQIRDEGAVLTCQELSPLQRMIKDSQS